MKRRRRSSRLRKIGFGLGVLLCVLASVVVVRAFLGGDRPEGAEALSIAIDRERAADVLSTYVQWDSSRGVPRDPRPPHLDLLIERYAEPLELEHRVLDGRTLLLIWRADDATGGPLVMLSHSDVVRVSRDELSSWSFPPFDGTVRDGYVWGRGTIDNKGAAIAQLEAIAAMQAHGLRPHRDILLLISPDQESGGASVLRTLERHGPRLEQPWAVLDEGSFVAPDFIPSRTLVPIAVAEKRLVTLTLTVVGEAGHASMPRENGAPRVLAGALGRLAALEHPVDLLPPTELFLDRISDHVPLMSRLALKNRWLFSPLVQGVLEQRPASSAMIRDTMAITRVETGIAETVIPARAVATVSLGLLPNSELDAVLERIAGAIDDPRVSVEVQRDDGACPTAPLEGEVWTRLERALASAYPQERAVIAPMITPGSTDARHFARRGIPTYRFSPFVLDANERGRLHGVDERISVENLQEAARVYAHLMRYW